MKKRYIFILSLILVILSMSCVSAGLFDGLFAGEDSDKNITLIKESTEGWIEIYDDGDVHSCYIVKGVFKDLPHNVDGYDLKIALYDENGKLIKEGDGAPIKSIAKSSEKSNPDYLCFIGMDKGVNVSIAEIKIFDDEGSIVFDKNITFTMENVEIRHVTKETSSSSDDDEYEHSDWYKKYQDSLDKQREKEIREGTYYPNFD